MEILFLIAAFGIGGGAGVMYERRQWVKAIKDESGLLVFRAKQVIGSSLRVRGAELR